MKSVERAIKAIADGEFVVVIDDKDRENEGDLVIAPQFMTAEKMAFMIRYTGGIICMPMAGELLDRLRIPQMVSENTDRNKTAFTVSVDYMHGTTTGVSAEDRTATVKALIDESSQSSDFSRPGHIFPLRYREGGVLKRAGHTEASVDLSKFAKLPLASVIGEIINEDGSMARGTQLEEFAKHHNLALVSTADIIRYRRHCEKLVRCVSQASIPTKHGPFTAHVYESFLDGIEHMALVKGDIESAENVLVRVHSECLTGDVFGSKRCDCGTQLDLALAEIAKEGCGVVVYLRGHEGRGIGLGHKLRAYNLQDQGSDTVEANIELGLSVDSREYGIGAQILSDLKITKLRLMTNNPAKYGGLEGYDLEITERVPLNSEATEENKHYLKTKKEKLGHLLEI